VEASCQTVSGAFDVKIAPLLTVALNNFYHVIAYVLRVIYAITHPAICLFVCVSFCHMGGSVKNS